MTEIGQQHALAMSRGARCDLCPLRNSGQGPVMGLFPSRPLLTVVLEAPSTAEVETGTYLIGPSGDLVWTALAEGGLHQTTTAVTSAVLCRPPGGFLPGYLVELNRAHKRAVAEARATNQPLPELHTPQSCCAPRLHTELKALNTPTILAIGNEGLKASAQYLQIPFGAAKAAPGVARVSSVKKQHGSPVIAPSGVTLTASLHPGMALMGSSPFLPVIRNDITRAAQTACHGGGVRWVEPEYILRPSADTCLNVLDLMWRSRARVTVDIETNDVDTLTADIRCVGLGAVIDGRELVIVVPLKHRDGRNWWAPAVEHQIRCVLTRVLEDNPLAGHNLMFDTAVLLQHRLLLNRGKRWFDTMIAHHVTDHSDLPHDLGFVFARFFHAPRWKEDADAKVVEGVDDYWLHLYCAKDVLGEMRLIVPLAQRVVDLDVQEALRTDLDLAPVARDMGLLGLPINERTRREYFDTLDQASAARKADVRRFSGRASFNPNAFKQVADFLYVQKRLTPPYATDGREWAELLDDDELDIDADDPETVVSKASTNEMSLLALLDLGVDQQTSQFIEALLAYRGVEKCKSTYLGLKWEEVDGKRVLTDTHRRRGYIHTETWGRYSNLSILHPSWKLHIVPTGRWATSPNAQNYPERVVFDLDLYRKTKEAKDPQGIMNTRAIVEAVEDHVLVGADYMAVELRIYAIQSGDALLLHAINSGMDPHSLNYASMMSRRPEDLMVWYKRVVDSPGHVKKYLRNIAKRFGFLVIYGGQRNKLFKTMAADRNPDGSRSFPDLRPDDVEMWFDNWHRMHPETRRWQEAVVRSWATNGFVGTLIDRRKRFFIGGPDPTAMPNMTIQGSAAAIMNRAMKIVAAECPYRGWSEVSGPILQVHDFMGLQVPASMRERGERLLAEAMPYEESGMRYEVEVKSDRLWSKI